MSAIANPASQCVNYTADSASTEDSGGKVKTRFTVNCYLIRP